MADKGGHCILPVSRIRTIMKSSPEVSNISQESVYLIAKATELFVQDLAKNTLKKSSSSSHLMYNTLASMVDEEDTLQFLTDIIPQKIKVKDYQALIRKQGPDRDS